MDPSDPEGAWCRAVLNDTRLTPHARDRVLAAAVRRLDWCAPLLRQHFSATHTAPSLLKKLLAFITVDVESETAELEHITQFDAVAAELCAAEERAERSEVVRLVRAYVGAALRDITDGTSEDD